MPQLPGYRTCNSTARHLPSGSDGRPPSLSFPLLWNEARPVKNTSARIQPSLEAALATARRPGARAWFIQWPVSPPSQWLPPLLANAGGAGCGKAGHPARWWARPITRRARGGEGHSHARHRRGRGVSGLNGALIGGGRQKNGARPGGWERGQRQPARLFSRGWLQLPRRIIIPRRRRKGEGREGSR